MHPAGETDRLALFPRVLLNRGTSMLLTVTAVGLRSRRGRDAGLEWLMGSAQFEDTPAVLKLGRTAGRITGLPRAGFLETGQS
ncbi:hypothetical protein RHA1_ro00614 [Rhodococcus jostii RHA1]|uniref:Uncharacterized protein n=1 Tax=Rhodococcus jostii (strain RHA1) TaxID=101510 RepID=Q0SJ37_RHOJR|nr:hypothetical protein RHA1_ro00614 [Rhodococcus jostii RHA1]